VAALRPLVFNRMARIGSHTESAPVMALKDATDGSVDVYLVKAVSKETATDALPEPAQRERVVSVGEDNACL
jgi:hypothetical protein